MERVLSEYKKLAAAQSKSIAEKSYKLWESELEIKEMKANIAWNTIEKRIKELKINTIVNPEQDLCLYPVFECTCHLTKETPRDSEKLKYEIKVNVI